ncbi:hypothetical protein [Gemmatimonas phototrophica]|nr:hypothetical protein [Gemmatimonas phototrophica]
MQFSHDPPLLALVDVTAEWHAGMPPMCSASVRLLDRVHFTVHRGDCVVVHHDDPAGARVLLAALAGSPALTVSQRWRGERRVAPQVRIRRCSITANALPHVLEGWRELHSDAVSRRALPSDEPEPVVHLLRASRLGAVSAQEARQWRAWARRLRLSQGAVVAVARPHPVRTEPAVRSCLPAQASAQLREADGATYDVSNDHWATRGLWLRFGQLLALRQWQ